MLKLHSLYCVFEDWIGVGKSGSKIKIGYREFINGMARPSFSNDIEYDLSDSKQIGYKGALIEVTDANNQDIKYKVLKGFK